MNAVFAGEMQGKGSPNTSCPQEATKEVGRGTRYRIRSFRDPNQKNRLVREVSFKTQTRIVKLTWTRMGRAQSSVALNMQSMKFIRERSAFPSEPIQTFKAMVIPGMIGHLFSLKTMKETCWVIFRVVL
jgi:hypothetical protein